MVVGGRTYEIGSYNKMGIKRRRSGNPTSFNTEEVGLTSTKMFYA